VDELVEDAGEEQRHFTSAAAAAAAATLHTIPQSISLRQLESWTTPTSSTLPYKPPTQTAAAADALSPLIRSQ
jgi:hypothetical protein